MQKSILAKLGVFAGAISAGVFFWRRAAGRRRPARIAMPGGLKRSSFVRQPATASRTSDPTVSHPIAYAKNVSPEWLALSRSVDFSQPDNDEVKLRAAILKSEGLPRPK